MKRSALEFYACPGCQATLTLRDDVPVGAPEVESGRLVCAGCSADFPIRNGIPRFVPSSGYASSFSYQWNKFRSVQIDSQTGNRDSQRTLIATSGWSADRCRGQLVLDAGVGAGRFAEVVADWGGTVFGIDLSDSVEAARQNVGRRPNVHIAQADIFHLPFRPGTFDLAYSIGVLDHTPDPIAAFEAVAARVKPGGQFAIYVYPDYVVGRRATDLIRRITTRLPMPLNAAISLLAVPLYFAYRLPVVGRWLYPIFPVSMHPNWKRRWLDTVDWYSPRYQFKLPYPEVYRWFRRNGFADVELFDEPIRMCGTKAGAAKASCETD